MELILVDNPQKAKLFIEVHAIINKHTTNWIRPLDKDIEQVFDPKKNKTFRSGELARWILKDNNGNYIGRIAAFVNKKYKTVGDEQPTGGCGFFDCIDNQEAANLLFDTAKNWLAERGMEAMDGPINFGERDNWWGLVVEGFHEPLYGMNFNPPYYQKLLETYGFQPFFHQLCFSLNVRDRVMEKHYTRHDAIAKDPAYSARYIDKSNLKKYAEDFATIYNQAWKQHGSGKDMAPAQAYLIFKKMKMVMDPKVVWFVYHNDVPIGCWLNLPELNQYFKHLNGKFGLFQKLYFLWLKMTRPNKKLTGIVFGLIPEFQGKGVDSFMIMEGAKIIQHELPYTDYEMQWIGDFNPKMVNVAASLGGFVSRKLTTYRYLFDRTKEFHRHPTV
ncbi:hypothetical protein [Chitinophaga skermanii]|nr:hypothetical protein [Chitinophaga skermanii]